MGRVCKKRKGNALPLYGIITVGFALELMVILLHWNEMLHVADDIKDSITISAQAVCLHDPAESSLFSEKEDVLFYIGSVQESMKYYTESEHITKVACENALRNFKTLLTVNLPEKYKEYHITKFEMHNVLSGVVYRYDAISGQGDFFVAKNEESQLLVTVSVVQDGFFGEIVLPVKETVFLRNQKK